MFSRLCLLRFRISIVYIAVYGTFARARKYTCCYELKKIDYRRKKEGKRNEGENYIWEHRHAKCRAKFQNRRESGSLEKKEKNCI